MTNKPDDKPLVGTSFPIGHPDSTVDKNPATPQSVQHTGGPSENPSPSPSPSRRLVTDAPVPTTTKPVKP